MCYESALNSTWGDFRPEYKEARRLRHIIPRSIPFFLTSATLPTAILNDVMDILQIHPVRHIIFHRSNDRPNVYLSVRKIQHALQSYEDLAFLVDSVTQDNPPDKFLVFFNNISDSVKAAKFLRKRLPRALRHKIQWYNADMSEEF